VADYAKTRDFYAGLFGMEVSRDNGKECRLLIGKTFLVVRNRPAGSDTTRIDHIAFTVAWDEGEEALVDELKRRGLETGPGTDIKDPDGFKVQLEPEQA
jgi:catechol 2,3-dioxygenase-like lactoylglutathione lyase family enzyme